jgi:uncharacterized membrane protein (UPF0127 family)
LAGDAVERSLQEHHAVTRAWIFIASLLLLAGPVDPGGSLSAGQADPECLRWRRAFAGMPTATLVVLTSGGRRIRTTAKMARAHEARLAGFQCATPDEISATVIVFDFHREILGTFHMQNVPSPLDIAFVTGSGRIFSILRMDPHPTATYGPMGAYRYAIEARAGFFKERGISSGDELMLFEPK